MLREEGAEVAMPRDPLSWPVSPPRRSEPGVRSAPGRDVAVQAGAGRAEAMDREDGEARAGLLGAHRGHRGAQLRREGHGQEESGRYVPRGVQSWVCERPKPPQGAGAGAQGNSLSLREVSTGKST